MIFGNVCQFKKMRPPGVLVGVAAGADLSSCKQDTKRLFAYKEKFYPAYVGDRASTPQIKINPLVKRNRIAIAPSLPIASNARLNQQTLFLVIGVSLDLLGQGRTWSHDTNDFFQLMTTGFEGPIWVPA